MGRTRRQRPAAPGAAERARSLAARGGPAALVGTGTAPVAPIVHHVRADGSGVLLIADDEPVLGRIRAAAGGELAAMFELTDRAPVPLRQPVRGLLWIIGRLWIPDADTARRLVLQVAEVQPHPELLRLGHGATLVRLDPGCAVLSDAEGSASLAPVELAAARPDPFHHYEQHWLPHLEEAHPEIFPALAGYLPRELRNDRSARIRPLGVDRCGLRLRVETRHLDHDVRLAWESGAATPAELRTQLTLLLGSPFRGAQAQRAASEQP